MTVNNQQLYRREGKLSETLTVHRSGEYDGGNNDRYGT